MTPLPPPVVLASLPEEFHAFTPMHALVVLVCGGIIWAACWLGRRFRGTVAERRIRALAGVVGLLLMCGYNGFFLWPSRFDAYYSLPLHVCDVAGWLAAFSLIFDARWLKTALYYFGLVLSSQAFIQPVLEMGPASMWFWCFWGLHLLIVGAAIYAVVVLRYRPTWRDYLWAVAGLVMYAALLTPLNVFFELNYMYIGPTIPGRKTLINFLGPWPLRLLWMALLCFAVFAMATAAWGRNRGRRVAVLA